SILFGELVASGVTKELSLLGPWASFSRFYCLRLRDLNCGDTCRGHCCTTTNRHVVRASQHPAVARLPVVKHLEQYIRTIWGRGRYEAVDLVRLTQRAATS